MLYLFFALGGVGLYLAMPRRTGSRGAAGAVLGAAAIVGLLAMLASGTGASGVYNVIFYSFAGVAIFAAGRVVTHTVPTYSAVYFGLVVLCVAVLLVLQMAEFLAVALIIIYAGAVLVTYVFVIMLAQQSGGDIADRKAREPLMVIAVSFVLMGALAGRSGDLPAPVAPKLHLAAALPVASDSSTDGTLAGEGGNTLEVGKRMFSQYTVVVELAGLLLLIAMVGAIAISRKRVPVEEGGAPPPLGQIGRDAPPF
jgi:NADH-quinone oxidoreductase subunit J